MASTILGRVGLVLKGEWAETTAYKALDVVSHNGYAWAAKIDSTGVEPSTTNSTEWQPLAESATVLAQMESYTQQAASSAEAGTKALANQAPVFSDSTAYSVGSIVTYDGDLYAFTSDHAAGAWTGTDATKITVGDEVSNLKSALDDVEDVVNHYLGGGTVQLSPTDIAPYEGYWTANINTKVSSLNPSTTHYTIEHPIDISSLKVGTNVSMRASLNSAYGLYILDADTKLIDYVNGNNAEEKGYTASQIPQLVTLEVPAGAKYIVSDIRSTYYTSMSDFTVIGTLKDKIDDVPTENSEMLVKSGGVYQAIVDHGIATEVKPMGINLYDPSKAQRGYINNSSGNIADSDSYVTSDFIPISSGQSVVISRIRCFLAYDVNKAPITTSYHNGLVSNYTYTATTDGYIRASLYVSYASSNLIAYGNTAPTYEPYSTEVRAEDDIHLSDTMREDAATEGDGIFYGKKWVACGDSFTHGSFTDSLTNDYIFTDFPYYGQNKVYPFWIGRRNKGLTVINEAISGSTMGAGVNGINPFSDARYTAIPTDTDYITLEFGINDAGHGVPIGTIDDTTNETFYGAWNVVLEYFAKHFPFAHIGIIVGPGMQTTTGQQYANAEIDIAKKWGIPYLNIQFESGNGKIPLMLRTSNPDVNATITVDGTTMPLKSYINQIQYVNPSETTPNYHPNEKAHEFESTFIEAWLRTL